MRFYNQLIGVIFFLVNLNSKYYINNLNFINIFAAAFVIYQDVQLT